MNFKATKLAVAIAAVSTASTVSAQCVTGGNVYNTGIIEPTTGLNVCIVDGADGSVPGAANPITTNLTMDANNLWLLNGKVDFGALDTDGNAATEITGSVLTIDPGTIVIGANDLIIADEVTAGRDYYSGSGFVQQDVDYLLINRGSDIEAVGTAHAPIRMTSLQDLQGTGASSQWGGLYINGYAPTNICATTANNSIDPDGFDVCENPGEANTGLFGGGSAADDSGTIKYLRVEYAGFRFTGTSELNGIAMQGVGSGTEVDFVQIHDGSDDGIEFFGGTVNVKHLVLTDNEDDSFDLTGGWQGFAQHIVIYQQDPTVDSGFEIDGKDGDNNAAPASDGVVSNVTYISTSGDSAGIRNRENADLDFRNLVFVTTNAANQCFRADDAEAGTAPEFVPNASSVLADCANDGDIATPGEWVTANIDTTTANTLDGIVNGSAESTVTAASLVDVPFFDQVSYIGAVNSCSDNWTAGWTREGSLPANSLGDLCSNKVNVPAMGWAGIVALFSGLVGVAGLARRRIK